MLKILTWNIGFAGGLHGLSGDNGGKSAVLDRLAGIGDVLVDSAADVACLQEVDRHSKRSFYIDQLAYLAERCGYPYYAFAQTWRRCWVPYPLTWRLDKHFGPMDAGQVILSKYPIVWHATLTHPKPASRKGVFRYFYLDRVSQIVGIERPDMPNDARIQPLCHVHFEAFDKEARVSQAKALTAVIAGFGARLSDMVVLGDFNAIPQNTGPFVFADEAAVDYSADPTLSVFASQGYVSAGLGPAYRDFPSPSPNRQLTHVMSLPGARVTGYQVLQTGAVSDHLAGMAFLGSRE